MPMAAIPPAEKAPRNRKARAICAGFSIETCGTLAAFGFFLQCLFALLLALHRREARRVTGRKAVVGRDVDLVAVLFQLFARLCEKAGVVLALGYQRRRESHFRWVKNEIDAGRFGQLVQAEGNISRDRLGKIDLSSWRYQAAGMPGGVMLQIGIHYVDVLEMLMGPVKRVSGMAARLVLPGDNPDVANLILEHENGALSNLTASYASASEYYALNIYGKEATAYYDLFNGLRHLKRGETRAEAVKTEANDAIREELDEFFDCVREGKKPETDGFWAARNLAVIKAGVKSAREGRAVEVDEILKSGE